MAVDRELYYSDFDYKNSIKYDENKFLLLDDGNFAEYVYWEGCLRPTYNF